VAFKAEVGVVVAVVVVVVAEAVIMAVILGRFWPFICGDACNRTHYTEAGETGRERGRERGRQRGETDEDSKEAVLYLGQERWRSSPLGFSGTP
jgi:hypothetical protein